MSASPPPNRFSEKHYYVNDTLNELSNTTIYGFRLRNSYVDGAYSELPLGWYADDASVSPSMAVPHVSSEDVCQGNMITPIVGAANQSRLYDAAFYSGPALGSGDIYPTLSYDVAEVMTSSSGRLPGFVSHPLQPLSQSEQEWYSRAFDIALENILRSSSFPTSQRIPPSKTPIVGAANQSRFLGKTDADFYSGSALW